MKEMYSTLMLSTLCLAVALTNFSAQAEEALRAGKPVVVAKAPVKVMKIDINRADIKSLMKIKGLGKRKAQAIIKYRNLHGDFKNIQQLKEIRGVTPALMNKLSDKIEILPFPRPRPVPVPPTLPA